ncbi:MAG TPA: RNA polymerase sigma factor [Acidobacteriaceae bacterium]|nr:RNA polymerase sigma factor [Acidobacteriaceae bacterium]
MELLEITGCQSFTDEEVVERVLAGETALYEILMRRYNQRLYRLVRAILRDDSEAEDVMQDAYVRAYQHLAQFENRAPFAAWLSRIAVHEALTRLRRRQRTDQLDAEDAEYPMHVTDSSLNPEERASHAEFARMLEDAILALPADYRTVLMLRDVEELSTAETAAALSISEANVKVRLLRGRAKLRRKLFERVGSSAASAFPFMGERCDRVVAGVFAKLGATAPV